MLCIVGCPAIAIRPCPAAQGRGDVLQVVAALTDVAALVSAERGSPARECMPCPLCTTSPQPPAIESEGSPTCLRKRGHASMPTLWIQAPNAHHGYEGKGERARGREGERARGRGWIWYSANNGKTLHVGSAVGSALLGSGLLCRVLRQRFPGVCRLCTSLLLARNLQLSESTHVGSACAQGGRLARCVCGPRAFEAMRRTQNTNDKHAVSHRQALRWPALASNICPPSPCGCCSYVLICLPCMHMSCSCFGTSSSSGCPALL